MKKKILISTGGSGGHVIPAMAFYDHLKENFDVFLVLDERGSNFINEKNCNYWWWHFWFIFCKSSSKKSKLSI